MKDNYAQASKLQTEQAFPTLEENGSIRLYTKTRQYFVNS